MKEAFDGKPVTTDEIVISCGREYGASDMLHKLAKKIGLDRVIYSKNEEWVKCSLAMIIGRIVYGGSKLSLSKAADLSCLWEICAVNCDKIDVDEHCYDAMDGLLLRQELIQQKLAKKHLSEGSAILYDITSSYFEGEYLGSELVTYGYNRDKKRGKKQITIGLICTREGCPVAVEVYAGNTTDCTTVQDKMLEIKKKYGITSFVFVGDRGMLTQKNIDECDDSTETITALTHSAMKKLCEHDNVQLTMFDENVLTEVILPEEPNIRYALKKNPLRLKKERKSRIRLIEKTEEELDKIAVPKKKTDDKTIMVKEIKTEKSKLNRCMDILKI